MSDQGAQRWTRGSESYRTDRDTINPSKHAVEEISEADARAFLTAHHYAGSDSYPSTQLRVGLYRRDYQGDRLVGAMVFGVPTSGASLTRWTGLAPEQGVVLQRLALLDEVEAFGETWFLSRAFEILQDRRPDVQAVVSYSDPVARADRSGRIYKPGHLGHIYKAFSGLYRGQTPRDDTYLAPDGTIIAPRSMSKLRNSEQGRHGVEERLRALGAPARLAGECDRDYAYRLVRGDLFLRRRRRPGCHVYTWPLAHGSARRRLLSSWATKPRPTTADTMILGPAELEHLRPVASSQLALDLAA